MKYISNGNFCFTIIFSVDSVRWPVEQCWTTIFDHNPRGNASKRKKVFIAKKFFENEKKMFLLKICHKFAMRTRGQSKGRHCVAFVTNFGRKFVENYSKFFAKTNLGSGGKIRRFKFEIRGTVRNYDFNRRRSFQSRKIFQFQFEIFQFEFKLFRLQSTGNILWSSNFGSRKIS